MVTVIKMLSCYKKTMLTVNWKQEQQSFILESFVESSHQTDPLTICGLKRVVLGEMVLLLSSLTTTALTISPQF